MLRRVPSIRAPLHGVGIGWGGWLGVDDGEGHTEESREQRRKLYAVTETNKEDTKHAQRQKNA